VAVECDGFRFHRTPDQLDWDARRQTDLSRHGWLVHRVTWRQHRRNSDELVQQVAASLRSRHR
jgi:very-short-patch-repair endonuclease